MSTAVVPWSACTICLPAWVVPARLHSSVQMVHNVVSPEKKNISAEVERSTKAERRQPIR